MDRQGQTVQHEPWKQALEEAMQQRLVHNGGGDHTWSARIQTHLTGDTVAECSWTLSSGATKNPTAAQTITHPSRASPPLLDKAMQALELEAHMRTRCSAHNRETGASRSPTLLRTECMPQQATQQESNTTKRRTKSMESPLHQHGSTAAVLSPRPTEPVHRKIMGRTGIAHLEERSSGTAHLQNNRLPRSRRKEHAHGSEPTHRTMAQGESLITQSGRLLPTLPDVILKKGSSGKPTQHNHMIPRSAYRCSRTDGSCCANT